MPEGIARMAALPPPTTVSGRRRPSRESREGNSAKIDAAVGQFRIQQEIGKGSFATVYRAIHVVGHPLLLRLFEK